MVPDTEILCFIGARGGSKRLRRKNLQRVKGKTLIENAIETALMSKLIDRIVFSSEDEEMLENAGQYNVDIHRRNPMLSRDDVDIADVAKSVLDDYRGYDTLVILQVDLPFITAELIDRCIQEFRDNLVQEVITHKNNLRTGSVRVISRDALFSGLPAGHIFLVEDSDNFVDIHTQKDLDRANEEIPCCLVCGSGRVGRFKEGLWRCSGCGVVFQYPQGDFDYSQYSRTRGAGRKKRSEQYILDIEEIMRYKTKGDFLDVGCGDGTFLSCLPPGFTRDGIDVRGGYRIGEFSSYNFDKNYDVVHMRGTLEHVKDPDKYIEKAWEVLKKEGLLVVSHLPNIDNYPMMKGLIKPDEHLFYFNPGSIERLLKKHNFRIINVGFPYYSTPYEDDESACFMNVLSVYAKKRGKR